MLNKRELENQTSESPKRQKQESQSDVSSQEQHFNLPMVTPENQPESIPLMQPKQGASTSTSNILAILGPAVPDKHEFLNEDVRMEPEKRRLDSLARLLALNGECAAVYYDSDTNRLLVTHNDIYVLKKNQDINNASSRSIIEVIKFFLEKNPNEARKLDILEANCYQSLIGALARRNLPAEVLNYRNFLEHYIEKPETPIIRKIIERIYASDSTSEWMMEDLNYFATHLKSDELKDWQKARQKGNKITTSRQSYIRKNLIDLQRIYQDCWHLVRDFKKAMRFIESSNLNDIQLIAIGQSGEHAEMRMIGYLLLNNKLTKDASEYIGIAKLCCLDCENAINIINKAISSESKKIEVTSSDDEDMAAVQSTLETRGGHGLQFGKNWGLSGYLAKEKQEQLDYCKAKIYTSSSSSWLGVEFPEIDDKTQQILKKISETYQSIGVEKTKERVSMQASPSDSSDKVEEQIEFDESELIKATAVFGEEESSSDGEPDSYTKQNPS